MVIALNTVLLGVCFALILYVAIDRRKWKKTLENYKPQRCSPNISRNLSEVNLVVSKRIPAQLKESSRSMDKIHRICITGGPCAGKTTSLARISERVESLG
jgi:signal recognition particle GTPase